MGRKRGEKLSAGREQEALSDDRGAVIVMVAIWLIGLLAVASLAIDGGTALVLRRAAQNAADHAALEAAWASCHAEDPYAAGIYSVTQNGYSGSDLDLNHVSGDKYQATVRDSFSTALAAIIGIDTFDVAAVAVSDCTVTFGAGGSVIWAGGDSCAGHGKEQLLINGNNLEATGRVHSNGLAKLDGNDNIFNDDFTVAGSGAVDNSEFWDNGSNNTFNNGVTIDNPGPWPWSPGASPFRSLAQYKTYAQTQSDGYFFNGDIDASNITSPGLYYATGKISVGGTLNVSVTLVSEDIIDISGSSQKLTAYLDGLLAYSGIPYTGIDQCDKEGVKMSGSNNDWIGTVYAPESLIIFDGSSNTTVSGSLVGYAIRVPGSAVNLSFGGGSGVQTFAVTLQE